MNAGLTLLRRSLPARPILVRLAGFLVLEATPATMSGIAMAHAVDSFRSGQSRSAWIALALFAIAIAIGSLATRALYPCLAQVVEETRDALIRRVVRGSLARIAATGRPGDGATTQLVEQVEKVRNLLGAILRSARNTVVPLVAAVAGLFVLDGRLALAVVIPLTLALLGYAALLPGTVARNRDAAIAEEELGAELTAVVQGRSAAAGLGILSWTIGRLSERVRTVGRADMAVVRRQLPRQLVVVAGTSVPLVAVFLTAAPLVDDGRLSVGDLVGATSYILFVLAPALGSLVGNAGGWWIQLMVVSDRLARIADAAEPADHIDTSADIAEPQRIIEVRGLEFRYRGDSRPVIAGLDLCVQRGQLVALVGASGAGKSTLAWLLAGLLPPTSGLIGTAAGASTCLIPQESYVFAGTLRDNLEYLRSTPAPDELLAQVVSIVGGAALLNRLGGMDGEIASGGGDLSAGERQRLVAARALLSTADLVVLDEATSALDEETERSIEAGFLAAGRTLVVSAHRLDLVHRADQVVYFDGRDVLVGAHDQLVLRSAPYRDLLASGGRNPASLQVLAQR